MNLEKQTEEVSSGVKPAAYSVSFVRPGIENSCGSCCVGETEYLQKVLHWWLFLPPLALVGWGWGPSGSLWQGGTERDFANLTIG